MQERGIFEEVIVGSLLRTVDLGESGFIDCFVIVYEEAFTTVVVGSAVTGSKRIKYIVSEVGTQVEAQVPVAVSKFRA